MPGTTKAERPPYRASKSWDYVSSDSLNSSENPPQESPSLEDSRDKAPDQQRATAHDLSSFENLMAVFPDGPPEGQGTPNDPDGNTCVDEGRMVGTFYTVVLALLGMALPIKEAVQREWLIDYVIAIYYVYLYGVSLIFLVGVEIYLILQARKDKKGPSNPVKLVLTAENNRPETHNGEVNAGYEEDSAPSQEEEPPRIVITTRRELSRTGSAGGNDLFFMKDKDQDQPGNYRTSLYLRIAIIVLGLATMVYDGLLIKQFQEMSADAGCGAGALYWPHIFHLAFLLIQTYFLFKHPHIQVKSSRVLFRVGLMHVFAANFCMGFRTFVKQSVDDTRHLTASALWTANGANFTWTENCSNPEDISTKAAPFLYPCVIEYCLLSAAIVYGMFTHNISGAGCYEVYEKSQEEQIHLTEINFHRTHRGLFLGIIVLAGTCTSIILFFSYTGATEDKQSSLYLLIYQITDITLHVIVLLVVIVAWIQMKKLTHSPDGDGFDIASVVLILTMAALVLVYIFKLISVIEDMLAGNKHLENILSLSASLLSVIVALLQASFIMEALCCYTLTEDQYEKKHGRAFITFLLIANISLWLFKTFQMRALHLEASVHVNAYGALAWTIIVNACVPLLIFYYLHCSACLAAVWTQAYRHEDKPPNVKVRLPSGSSGFPSPAPKYLHMGEIRHRTPAKRRLNLNNVNFNSVDSKNIISPISDV